MTIICWRCKQPFDVDGYNLCRGTIVCPITACGTHNAFAEAVGRTHGASVGQMAARTIEHLASAGTRRKRDPNVSGWAGRAWEQLEQAVNVLQRAA